jgi:Uma2 family endonuclease
MVAKESLQTHSDELVIPGVSLDDYMEHYAQHHYEWVEGVVIKMSPIHIRHYHLVDYLRLLLKFYFGLRPIGQVLGEPFVMRLPAFPNRRREPDLMVILDTNPHELKDTYMDGPADICIEVVSEGSISTDHGEKFEEYEKGGVPEYWIIDPLRAESRFYRLNRDGRYVRQELDDEGHYQTPALPGLVLDVTILWQENLPDAVEVVQAVREMLTEP